MTMVEHALRFGETLPIPDRLARLGIEWLVGRTGRKLSDADVTADEKFARSMADYPIARNTAH